MSNMFDIVFPSIIVGMLLSLILGIQFMMVESSVETRVTQDLQGFADIAVQVVNNEVRSLNQIVELTDSTLIYSNTQGHQVAIKRENTDLKVLKTANGDTVSINKHALRLENVSFETVTVTGLDDVILRVRVITTSTPSMEVGNRTHRHRAFAHKDIYLRNLNL